MSTKLQPGERNWRKRLAAIGSCGMALCGGMPVMQSFYAMMLRAGRGETGSLDEPYGGMARMARGMSYVYSEPSVAARVSFHAAFGLDAADQVRLERAYDRVNMRYGSPDDLRHTVCSLFRI